MNAANPKQHWRMFYEMKLLFNCFCFVGSSKFFSSKLTDVKIILQIKSTSDKKCFSVDSESCFNRINIKFQLSFSQRRRPRCFFWRFSAGHQNTTETKERRWTRNDESLIIHLFQAGLVHRLFLVVGQTSSIWTDVSSSFQTSDRTRPLDPSTDLKL